MALSKKGESLLAGAYFSSKVAVGLSIDPATLVQSSESDRARSKKVLKTSHVQGGEVLSHHVSMHMKKETPPWILQIKKDLRRGDYDLVLATLAAEEPADLREALCRDVWNWPSPMHDLIMNSGRSEEELPGLKTTRIQRKHLPPP